MEIRKMIPVILCLSMFVGVNGCSSDEDDSTPEETELTKMEFTTSRITAYGDDWIYFSFKEGKEVNVSEDTHTTDATWDLAFNRYNIRTNSGLSGNGKGGAYDAGAVEFASVQSAPTSGYVIDTKYEISDIGTGFPPPTKMSTANVELCKAIGFTGPPPAYTPNEHVYVVKTADGKYAKVIFTSFYDDKGNSGFISFTYAYQSNGTVSLK